MPEPPTARDGKVTRELVLATALEIIDRDGAGAPSMRRLGDQWRRRAVTGASPAAERIKQMTDGKATGASGQETSPRRCWAVIRTDRGWERCHRDEHNPSARHHVRDRSWLSTANTPRLRFGQPCGAACTWPDLVIAYRSGTGRKR